MITPEKISMYRKHPVQACRDLLNIKLHWTQRIMLRVAWITPNVIWLATRSLGKTYMIAIFLSLKCMLYKNMHCGVFASSYQQACFTFDKLDMIYRDSPFLRMVTNGPPSRSKDSAIFEFKNGSYIKAAPVRRGDRLNIVVIDEYRDIAPADMVTIQPFLLAKHVNQKNQILIASTATYESNHFYLKVRDYREAIDAGDTGYAITEFNIDDILSGDNTFIDEEMLKMIKKDLSPDEIEMELYCHFIGLSDGWISGNMVRDCEIEYPPELKGNPNNEYIISADLGRVKGGDNSVFTVFRIVPGEGIRLVRVVVLNGRTFDEQRIVLGQLVRDYGSIFKIIMDHEKLGIAIQDVLKKPTIDPRDGEYLPPIVPIDEADALPDALKLIQNVNFRNKEEIWQRGKEARYGIQAKIIHFPKDYYKMHVTTADLQNVSDEQRTMIEAYKEIADLKREICNIQVKTNETTTSFSFVPGPGSKGKDDRFVSFFLGASLCVERWKEMNSNDDANFVGCWGSSEAMQFPRKDRYYL